MGIHPNDRGGPRRAAIKAIADEEYAKYQTSRNRLENLTLSKADREEALREVRLLQQIYGLPPVPYNGDIP